MGPRVAYLPFTELLSDNSPPLHRVTFKAFLMACPNLLNILKLGQQTERVRGT
jgi:hypothetical protein